MKKILIASLLLSSIASFGQSPLVKINDCNGFCPTYYIGVGDSIVITIKIDSKLTTRNVRLCYSNAPACASTLYPYSVSKLVIKPRFLPTNKFDMIYECNVKVEDGNIIAGIRFVFSSALTTSIEDDNIEGQNDTDKKYFDLNGREINNPNSYEGVMICNRKKIFNLR